jgi:very-short-patch-repair endonuclease
MPKHWPAPDFWYKVKPQTHPLVRQQTECESLLWGKLRAKQLDGIEFQNQVTIGPFIVPFYCPGARLVIEIDEPDAPFEQVDPALEEQKLAELGVRVIRFQKNHVLNRLDVVLEIIKRQVTIPPAA